MTTLLRGKNLGYRIDGVDIVQGVDFEVGPGEMIGLIGPNGAGKSTLLRLMMGLIPLSSGEVWLNGQPLSSSHLAMRARMFGYLAQGARAAWPLSVQRVVELGRLPHQGFWQHISSDDLQAVEDAMRLAEVTAYRNRTATTLSGGEQTLVMLARILATRASLIFADEPVAALDPYHQLHVMEILRDHARDDCATVVVLHDLSLAARFCDRIYLLQHGRLFCVGRPNTVLTRENIAAVYGVDSQIRCDESGVSVLPIRRAKPSHP